MAYIMAVISIVLVIVIYLSFFNNEKDKEENILDDMPVIDVNGEDLEKHAMQISKNYSYATKSNCRRKLFGSLDISYKKIIEGYEHIDRDVREKKDVAPASEWLLDNLYLIEKEYKHIKHNMPKSYYKDLPVIKKGMMKGYPRIYHIAVELVSHTDARIDEHIIERFIRAYQSNSVLTSGEIWSLPIMLRIALIQNISKITEKIVMNSKEKSEADKIADRLINAVENQKTKEEVYRISREDINFTSHFTERLLKVLRDNGIDSSEIYEWIDERLEMKETNSEKMINLDHQEQATYQVSIGNSISSIREVEALNWRESFEHLSFVENVLREDPANIYSTMDFESRDYYRHRVEKLANIMKKPESFIAKKAVQCAEEAEMVEGREFEKHVGYYLVDDGVDCLKKKSYFKDKGIHGIKNSMKSSSVGYYVGVIAIGTIIAMSIFLAVSYMNDTNRALWRYVVAGFILIVPCSEIIVSVLNWSINNLTTPRFISKIEYKEGIGEENRTIVVIPTIINSVQKVHELLKNIEVYHLANLDDNIYFTLLSDFQDSSTEVNEEDEKIVEAALEHVKKLNNKYSKDKGDKFFFFSRYRKYNEKEAKWLGWERKRGKLEEFNALIRGEEKTSYNVISGDISELKKASYVITLDSDTQLPRDSAKKLVGAMSHILNKPCIDKPKKRVTRGYGLMQPRISISTLSANKTIFSRMFSGETGLDTYTTAVSDVYQDFFGEGIFTGKGIYHIDTFNEMLKGEIPENMVLSHDLLEGSYVRTALVTDVELIDSYPAYYMASSKRFHRWVRGDWQLLPWIKNKKSINSLSKWKLLDNLRRSLVAPSIMLLILLSFNVLPDGTDKWVSAAVLALIAPILFNVSESVTSPIRGISLSGRINNSKTIIEQVFLTFAFLPFIAYLTLNAIVKTLYRVYVSKKNLLEWQTAADAEAKSGKSLTDYIAFMWIGSLISAVTLTIAFNRSSDLGIFMLPSCAIWFLSPWIACYISKDIKEKNVQINTQQETMLRRIGRKTWAYFEDFVNEENNWLAPDNYQEDPSNGVAHRTSPTNIAMGLTSNLVAYDLGYIGLVENINRLENVVRNVEDLKGYRGHLFNWYNTITKEPLHPKYVSTVDSGNLVGYLWLLEENLREYLNKPAINREMIVGLSDTLTLASEEISRELTIKDYYENDINTLKGLEFTVFSWKELTIRLRDKALEIEKDSNSIELYWNNKVKSGVNKFLEEIELLFPWADTIGKNKENDISLYNSLNRIVLNTSLKNIGEELNNVLENSDSSYKTIEELKGLIQKTVKEVETLIQRIELLMNTLNKMVESTDFKMLYDKKRGLFSIGYDVERDSLGKSYYDLLASEARQASFVAIAKGDVGIRHWFKLGRSMAIIGRSKGLVSWTGTMFEYLMPLLIMKPYPNTLLTHTYKAIVEGQKKYGGIKKVPWGISESAYKAFDVSLNYQYKAFGIPGIGLKRGLKNELVVSPYSTVLALQVDPKSAIDNMNRLINEGLEGRYGFYEAIDYTKDRMINGQDKSIIKCFMVHHEGMSLMALDNVLKNNILVNRFHNIPSVKATELLLQEKVPNRIVYEREQRFEVTEVREEKQSIIARTYDTALTPIPETQLFSNGSYSMMISNSGSGYGKKNDMTVYRWKGDVTSDNSGMFFYIKDVRTNNYWSSTYEPCKSEGDDYKVIFSQDKAEFKRVDGDILTYTEITVSSEDDAEIRKISLTNTGSEDKILEITSYCEVTLAPFNSDIVHPAFGNLFISTEFIQDHECIIANRRPRAKGQKKPYVVQCIALEGNSIGTTQYETSRADFIGRGKSLMEPIALGEDTPLKNNVGPVLDPIISMRKRLKLEPGETCRIVYTTAVADSREHAIELAIKYKEIKSIDRVFEIAWSQSTVEMKYLGIKSPQANLYQLMASRILYQTSQYRDREDYIKNIKRSQQDLWKYGISGDVPIVLVEVKEEKDKDTVRQMLNAHEYWSVKGLKVDLIILNVQNVAYTQPLQDSLRDLIATSHARDKQNKSGGVFLTGNSTMEQEDMDLLKALARIVIDGSNGLIINQIKKEEGVEETSTTKLLSAKENNYVYESYKFKTNKLDYYNGYGGFDLKDNKYVIVLRDRKITPAPWINVIANEDFGFIVSESGSPYTWHKNSRENKITTWSNDWVIDPPSEALYLRDDDSGDVWSIAPKPIRDDREYVIEHGFGYSNFKHEAYGIIGEVSMFVPIEEKVKLLKVKLKNNSNLDRKISLTYYAHLVLGVVPQQTATNIATYLNEEKKYIYAQNSYSSNFSDQYAYLKIVGGNEESFTGNRTEFIGRGKNIENPDALKRVGLSNDVGAGMDPCLAENAKISLRSGEEKTLIVIFGEDAGIENIEKIINKYVDVNKAEEELENVKAYWNNLLGTIKVKTPDKSMDIMLNGWLLYQTIVCRVWARSGFYQSGGAFGFRDQLQDVMAVAYVDPNMTREHILYSATRQFVEGDVQHWWHPVIDSGIRTRFSDDLLWLPYVTVDYVKRTGDYSILNEQAGYLEDKPLEEGEDERYTISRKSDKTGTIYEHCVKAIEKSLKFGSHNIPLMGSGDWNDGMSEIGNKGKGESVWLGWFLYSILDNFKDICKAQNDEYRVQRYEEMKEFIKENLNKNAWDGNWFRRAYFDDGTPLGSAENDECQIDSLSQSWAVISKAGEKEKTREAMKALEKYLIKEDTGMVFLLTPPFADSKLEPGYIKGYVPGVRENGGQYTHASTWVVLAMAELGEGNKAWETYNMLNPINHTKTFYECERYKVEPYVMAADVYGREPHIGRGGWSWYTGASGWMYRVAIEGILGLRFNGKEGFTIDPVIPDNWNGFDMEYTKDKCKYKIKVSRGQKSEITLDGNPIENRLIPILDEGIHQVNIVLEYSSVNKKLVEIN